MRRDGEGDMRRKYDEEVDGERENCCGRWRIVVV
jgi:hypothetical protein